MKKDKGVEPDGSIGLFDEKNESLASSLFIIKDGSFVDMTLDELFDASVYDTFDAVSYVSSPRFFSERVKDFHRVCFILGIDDSYLAEKFTNGLQTHNIFDINKRSSFFDSMVDEAKEMVVTDALRIRFSKEHTMIHTKLYLLSNEQTQQYRIIIGSANFSAAAFSNENRNFELIAVSDKKEDFDLCKGYFDKLFRETVDYIPERVKRNFNAKEAVFVESGQLQAETLIDEIIEKRLPVVISEETMEEIRKIPGEIVYEKQDFDGTEDVLHAIVGRKNKDGYHVKTVKELQKRSIRNLFCRTSKKTEEADQRQLLNYNPADMNIYELQSEEEKTEIVYGKPASVESIQKSLRLIDRFLESYKKYSVNPSERNQSKIYEAILYAFLSPFIWYIRKESSNLYGEKSLADIPIFFMMGGKARSGKTTAIEFIALLMGQRRQHYMHYADVSTVGVLHDMLQSSNLTPIIVDEVDNSFFHGKNTTRAGANMIKNLANKLPDHPAPVFIGTTNLDEFSASEQVIRRIYYLECSNFFDKTKKEEAGNLLVEIDELVDDSLFRDFCFRVSTAIRNHETIFHQSDFLSFAREIFQHYYEEAEIDVPSYFPKALFDDYSSRQSLKWRNIYTTMPQHFKVDGDNLNVYIDEICRYSKGRNQKQMLRDYLRDSCLRDDSGVVWQLDKDEFFRFIGLDKKGGILQRIKNKVFGTTES